MDVLFNSLQGFGGNETWYTLRNLFFSGFLVIEQEMLLGEADVPCVAVGSLLLLYGLLLALHCSIQCMLIGSSKVKGS